MFTFGCRLGLLEDNLIDQNDNFRGERFEAKKYIDVAKDVDDYIYNMLLIIQLKWVCSKINKANYVNYIHILFINL